MKENIVSYRLARDERETHYYYQDGNENCFCDTTIPKDIRKLSAKGWQMISCDKDSDGNFMAALFMAPANYITPRAYTPGTKKDKAKRVLSDEHKRKLLSSRKNNIN